MRSLLLVFVLLCARSVNAQVSNVFTQAPVEHEWLMGSFPKFYGLQQYSSWLNTRGDVMWFRITEKPHGGVLQHRWTLIWFGSKTFRVPLPAAAVAAIVLFILLLFGWLLAAGCHWIFTRRGKTETETAPVAP